MAGFTFLIVRQLETTFMVRHSDTLSVSRADRWTLKRGSHQNYLDSSEYRLLMATREEERRTREGCKKALAVSANVLVDRKRRV